LTIKNHLIKYELKPSAKGEEWGNCNIPLDIQQEKAEEAL